MSIFSKKEKHIVVKQKKEDSSGFLSDFKSIFSVKSKSTNQIFGDDPTDLKTKSTHVKNDYTPTWQQAYAQKKVSDTRYTSNDALANGELGKNLEALQQVEKEKTSSDNRAKIRASLPLFYRLINPDMITSMQRMGATNSDMLSWEKHRIRNTIIYAILGVAITKFALSMNLITALVSGIGVGFYSYLSAGKSINHRYQIYQFNREMQFSKFTRLLVPYLSRVTKGQSLYHVFAKIEPRLDADEDQRLLQILMSEMSEDSESAKPFVNFARSFSTDPFSVLFMRAVNNMRQTGSNANVIMGLAKEANQRMIDKVRAIRDMKTRKFALYTTYVTMLTMMLIGSQIIAIIIQQVSAVNF